MTSRAAFVLSLIVGLPVQAAADQATVPLPRGDALGSGLAALWRDAHADQSALGSWLAEARRPLIPGSAALFLPTWSMRNAGIAMAPSYGLSRTEVLSSGTGFAARFDTAQSPVMARDQNPPNWWSTAASFEAGAWRAFAAHELAQDWSGPGATGEGWRLGAAYRFRGAQVSAGWERLRHDFDAADIRQQAWWIGLAQRVGDDGALRLNFARAADISGNLVTGLGGARQLSLGYEHGLSPQTAVYAFYTRLSNDPNGLFRLGGGEVESALSAAARNGISLGVRHSF